MRITKIYWKRFKSPVALATGILLGCVLAFLRFAPDAPPPADGVAPVADPTNVTDSPTSAMVERLKGLMISGTMTINGDTQYEFVARNGGGQYWTDRELANVGVTIKRAGPCRVEAYYDSARVPILCF